MPVPLVHSYSGYDVLTRIFALQPDPKPFGDDVAGDIVDVLVTFVEIHQ